VSFRTVYRHKHQHVLNFAPNFLIFVPEDFRDAFCVAGLPLDAPDWRKLNDFIYYYYLLYNNITVIVFIKVKSKEVSAQRLWQQKRSAFLAAPLLLMRRR